MARDFVEMSKTGEALELANETASTLLNVPQDPSGEAAFFRFFLFRIYLRLFLILHRLRGAFY